MILSSIIDKTKGEHTVEPYRFKVLALHSVEPKEITKEISMPIESNSDDEVIDQANLEPQINPVNEAPNSVESTFIEELLKKTDDLSGNIVKLQMQIENQENEFKIRLENEIIRAKEEGLREGLEQAKAQYETLLNENSKNYTSSIQKLDEETSKLESLLSSSQGEIAATAIDIAKEVVLKEIKDSSAQIASNIAKNLIDELSQATSIEIKVSPKDYEFLKSNFTQKSHIKITSDDAVLAGGVIVLSNIGNIDGSVMARFNKIKKILSE
ncbi:flagellar assembly protein FliH [Campylobacter sp. CX2-8023-23]|uniref:Flagellar assembly protein FliH n=1 Tax=Campylobacter porcelli TaxID=1660073 RepID=A0ABU7M322_9BACT|nr:flagellar assembly protein FliH [Campylobacter sp. CX2-8023-23]MEE3744111.1 flagellar assembly protein FliH [Campylobacter sp. CX2-4855-23]